MKKLNLPKGYLSWSQFNLWTRNPKLYRQEYYYGVKREASAEMKYGDTIARMLEMGAKGPVIDLIPRFSVSEHKIETEIMGVPILAFIDTFDPLGNKFMEFKSGHRNAKGQVPWDTVKVRKHEQLPFYAAAITAKHGKCAGETKLIWIETEMIAQKEDFGGGLVLDSVRAGNLRLTGKVEVFPRKIAKWETIRMMERIKEAAEEISKDFTMRQKDIFSK